MRHNVSYKITEIEKKDIWPLEDVKNYLRVSHNKDDKLISNLTHSAIDYAEKFLGMDIFTKKIICECKFATGFIRLKHQPILSLEKVFVVDGELKNDITENFGHIVENESLFIVQKYWNKTLEISYISGIGDDIPKSIIHGIIMHIGAMYDFGEDLNNISSEIRDMYLPYRRLKI